MDVVSATRRDVAVAPMGTATPGRETVGRDFAGLDFTLQPDAYWGQWESIPAPILRTLLTTRHGRAPGRHIIGHATVFGPKQARRDATVGQHVAIWCLTTTGLRNVEGFWLLRRRSDGLLGRTTAVEVLSCDDYSLAGPLLRDQGTVPSADPGGGSGPAGLPAAQDLGLLSYLPGKVRQQLLRFVPEPTLSDAMALQFSDAQGVPTSHLIRGIRCDGSRLITVEAHRGHQEHPLRPAASYPCLQTQPWQIVVHRAELLPPQSAQRKELAR